MPCDEFSQAFLEGREGAAEQGRRPEQGGFPPRAVAETALAGGCPSLGLTAPPARELCLRANRPTQRPLQPQLGRVEIGDRAQQFATGLVLGLHRLQHLDR